MNAKQRVQRQLEDLLKQPGNDRCADCRTPAPRWASTNLGIFLCITCASVHRKMGTHRSRVKSVTLDEWTREQVSFMREMGNSRSNAIYNPDERMHPPPSVTSDEERDSEIAKYIRRKYELRAFARGADKSLATSNAVTSRARAQAWHAGTNGDVSPTDIKKDLPALPAPPPPSSSSRRPVRSPSGPVWSGLTANTTGSSSGTSASRTSASGSAGGSGSASAASAILTSAPTRSGSLAAPTYSSGSVSPARSPVFGAQQLQTQQQQTKTDPNLLIDLSGTTSSTRPLQVNNFPTIPYQGQQPPAATPGFAPLPSPGATSPLSLGQQAFPFQQLSPGNPFQQQGSYFQPMQGMQSMSGSVSPGVGMGMGMGVQGAAGGGMTMGMGMNGTMPNGMQMGGLSVPMGMNGMSPMSPMGGGMNGMSPMNGMNGINTMNPMYASAYPQQQGWYVQGM